MISARPTTASTPTPHPTVTPETHCDPTYLLFQQALVERSSQAWETIYVRYLPLVLRWVQQEPAFALSEEEAPDFANRAFAKLWRSMTPAKFAKFVSTGAILQYLHLCVRSVVVDQARAVQRRQIEMAALYDDEHQLAGADVAQSYWEEWERYELWRRVQANVKNEKERQLLYQRFVLGNKPSRICAEQGELFGDPGEVSALLQNILARLRRDQSLQHYAHSYPSSD